MSSSSTITAAICPSYHTVTLPDGTIIKYLLRGLRNASSDDDDNDEGDNNNDDINEWTNFCALAFAHKKPIPPTASYFYRHYSNDPRRDANLVRVMVSLKPDEDEKEEEMASSVRIFRRTLSSGNCSSSLTFEAGGIGEVCTSPNHRRRGLSTILLHNALTIMQDDSNNNSNNNNNNNSNNNNSGGMSCSVLHASPEFRPYYTKVGGYQSVHSLWSVVPIEYTNLTSSITTDNSRKQLSSPGAGRFTVRNAIFPQDAPRLYQLYKLYSEHRLVTIVRSLEYWENYVSVELSDSLWVLSLDTDDDCNIVAWMSIKEKGSGRYQLREFGLDRQRITTTLAMSRLLYVTLDQVMGGGFFNGSKVEEEAGVSLLLPSFVLSEIKEESMSNEDIVHDKKVDASFMKIDGATEENDDGWMYVNFDNSSSPTSIVDILTREHDCVPHLIWPTDSF